MLTRSKKDNVNGVTDRGQTGPNARGIAAPSWARPNKDRIQDSHNLEDKTQRRAWLLRPPVLSAAQLTPDVGLPVHGGGDESGVACDVHSTPKRSDGFADERRK